MGVVDSIPTSLWTKPIAAIEEYSFFLGVWAIVARMSNIPADLARHASFQGLKCLHLSLILGIILKILEEEINLHSEHVGLLNGVHTSLARLEAIVAPTLVGNHLLDQ